MDSPAVLWVPVHRIPTGLGFLWTQTGLQSSPIPKNCMEYHTNKLDLESTGIPKNPQKSSGIQWIYMGDSKDLVDKHKVTGGAGQDSIMGAGGI